jgi:hypothetical protein
MAVTEYKAIHLEGIKTQRRAKFALELGNEIAGRKYPLTIHLAHRNKPIGRV